MIDAELGKKLVCPSCAVKFYDLKNDPATCPKCDTIFTADPILPSKEDRPPATEEKPAEEEKKDDEETTQEATPKAGEGEAETISIEDIIEEDDDDDDDDEMAAIKDVDLGDDGKDEPASGEDDNTFLDVGDDDGSNVSDIVGGGPADEDDS